MDASSLTSYSIRQSRENEYIALLIGQYGSSDYPEKKLQEESLQELVLLADTAGIYKYYELFLPVKRIDIKYFLRKGNIERISEIATDNHINLVIIDCALKPNQLRNLEELLKIRVIGRVELILDIFAMRAKSKSSALQVEMAQLSYILPRLKGLGGVLSRLGGGIGTRGPGETMLETDRRHIRRRIKKIENELEKHSRHLKNSRKNRKDITFALVGYTNAGKTSLLNRLSSSASKLFAEDRLFATLDVFSRKVFLGNINYKPLTSIVTDTIGFISNLPANLVAAFRSTLEEINYTDATIIVIDASSYKLHEELHVVKSELEALHLDSRPIIYFFNKQDLVFNEDKIKLQEAFPFSVWGDTLSKKGVLSLIEKMKQITINLKSANNSY